MAPPGRRGLRCERGLLFEVRLVVTEQVPGARRDALDEHVARDALVVAVVAGLPGREGAEVVASARLSAGDAPLALIDAEAESAGVAGRAIVHEAPDHGHEFEVRRARDADELIGHAAFAGHRLVRPVVRPAGALAERREVRRGILLAPAAEVPGHAALLGPLHAHRRRLTEDRLARLRASRAAPRKGKCSQQHRDQTSAHLSSAKGPRNAPYAPSGRASSRTARGSRRGPTMRAPRSRSRWRR